MKKKAAVVDMSRKAVAEVAERMRAFCFVRESASRELIRKWAREIEAALNGEAD
jgi:hypothetical protein